MVEPLAGLFGAVAMVIAEPLLPYTLAFAAGAMIYVVFDDIIPEAQASYVVYHYDYSCCCCCCYYHRLVHIYSRCRTTYVLFTSYGIMWTLISLPLQMAERLRRAQPVSVAIHVKARQSLIERAVTWLATESGWARSKRSAFCSGKLISDFMIWYDMKWKYGI